MNNLEIFDKRHSVRQFKEDDVPDSDIRKILQAAVKAPSGKNLQNWHFIVLKNNEKIKEIAHIIEVKNEYLSNTISDKEKKKNFMRYARFGTHFKDAPALILVYAGEYPITGLDIMKDANLPDVEIEKMQKASPGIQNIGAAVENMLLAAAELGYGTCWMTSQNYAISEIEDYIGFKKEGYNLVMITPLGIPAKEPGHTPRKDIDEVTSWIK